MTSTNEQQKTYTVSAKLTEEQYLLLKGQGTDLQMVEEVGDNELLIRESYIPEIIRHALIAQFEAQGDDGLVMAMETLSFYGTQGYVADTNQWPFAVRARILEWAAGISYEDRESGSSYVYYAPKADDARALFEEFPQLTGLFTVEPGEAGDFFGPAEEPVVSKRDELIGYVRELSSEAVSVVATGDDTDCNYYGMEDEVLAIDGVEDLIFQAVINDLEADEGSLHSGVYEFLYMNLTTNQVEGIRKLIRRQLEG